jgi:hypothetical protein
MRTLHALTAAAVTTGMLLAVACARPDEDKRSAEATLNAAVVPAKASCDMVASLGTCNEYRAGTSYGLERSQCDGFKGKFAVAHLCPEQGRIGRCEIPGGEVKRYYAERLTRADAKADCESELVRGTFIAD